MDAPISGGGGLDLFSKVGPLPAWGWAALVVGGYVGWQHFHGSAIPVVDNTTDGVTVDPSAAASDYAGGSLAVPASSQDAGYNYGDVLGGTYTGTVGGTVGQFQSNQQWGVYVIANLIPLGVPASLASTAITHYLRGERLTVAEVGVVNQAITDFGPPPLPLPVNVVSSPGSTATPTAPHLSGATIAGHKVQMQWTRPSGATSFMVFSKGVFWGTTTATSRTSGRLRPGSHYGPITVRAVGNGKVSGPSNPVTVIVK